MTPLHYAAYGRDAGLVNFLIDKGAKLELRTAEGKTPLHIAAMTDRARDGRGARSSGARPSKPRNDYERTALILCARERGQAATARLLIEAGADVNAVTSSGHGSQPRRLAGKEPSSSTSSWKGRHSSGERAETGGDAVSRPPPRAYGSFRRLTERSRPEGSATPAAVNLLRAAAGRIGRDRPALLDKGFDPARPDRFGWTPLHYAARDGRTDAARILIEKGAPLDARTIMGQTPYNVALERKMEGVAALLAEKGADKSDIRFPELKGDYLGQKPPAETPELFALGIISSIWGLHSTAVFTPDGNEVYWSPMVIFPGEIYSRGGLLMMKRAGGRWTAPAWPSFSGPEGRDDVPFFTADGKRIYFISRRLLPGEKQGANERIWFADRTRDGWSEPRPIDAAVNEHNMHWEFSLDREGNLYFGGGGTDSRGMSDIFLARFVGGKYERPVNLGDPINSAAEETTPFVAPDGSYLLFSRQFDLWASFRGAGGAWTEPVKFGPGVNSTAIELCPMVTADGKYLFFLSQRDGESHVYWVSAAVIEKLRPAGAKK